MDREHVDRIIERHGAGEDALIQILLDIQREAHWLPPEARDRVAERLGVPPGRIRQVATFYKAFSLVPKGRHEVCLCMGTACHVRGAGRVLTALEEAVGIGPGETDPALRFSLETVNCLGCCALGPVVDIDGKIYGKVSPHQVGDVLKPYA